MMDIKQWFKLSRLTLFLLSVALNFSFASADGWKLYSEGGSGVYGWSRPALVKDGYVYSFEYGGYFRAKLQEDGRFGEMTALSTAYGMGLEECSVTATGNCIYFSGGRIGDSALKLNSDWVYYTFIDSQGYLSDPIATYNLKSNRALHASLIVNNRLYVFGGYQYNLDIPGYALKSVEYADIDTTTGGIKGPFQYTFSFSTISGQVYLAFNRGNRIYCLGETSEVPYHPGTGCWLEYADIQTDGSLGEWTALPGPFGFNAQLAVLTDSSTLFVVGPPLDTKGHPAGRMDLSDNEVEGKYFRSAETSLIYRDHPAIATWSRFVYLLGGGSQASYEVYDPDLTGTGLFADVHNPLFQASESISIPMDLK